MRLAYSYIRFSTPEQKKGDSKRRQLDECEKFCQENKLVLETSRRFYDEGKSGWKGKHITEGALGAFLELVKKGRVPRGSVLIVEAFDRLNRQDTVAALKLFLGILEAGVDVVTLVDRQWYSQETINKNLSQLMMSIGAMWSANYFSVLLSDRLGKAWNQKRKLAIEQKKPFGAVCPGWLRISNDKKSYEVIQERVKIVRLVFWLSLRGWGKQRIASFFNRHLQKVPTWGVKGKKSDAWHYSYIQKILTNRAVLGEMVPHSTVGSERDWKRRPTGQVIRGYFPQIIDETTFLQVQNLGSGPKGPRRDAANNLFQGLLKDGEHPEFSMWYKDHGDKNGKWVYVISDYRRPHPESPIFSWPYKPLERLILHYLLDMDWSTLTAGKDQELRKLKKGIEVNEARLADMGRQIKRLIELGKAAGDVEELAGEMAELRTNRDGLRFQTQELRKMLSAKQDFSTEDAAVLIRELASGKQKSDSRKQLREVIRSQVQRIELFRQLPARLFEGLKMPRLRPGLDLMAMLKGRCVRILFKNGVERWVVDSNIESGYGVRFEGDKVPRPEVIIVEPDRPGGKHLVDSRKSERVLKMWEKARKKWRRKGKKENE